MDTHCTRHSHAWIARVPHGATRAQQAAHCRAQLKAELLIAPLITDWLQAGGAQSSQQRQSQQPSKTATTATCGERLRAGHARDRDLSSAAGGFLELWQWARVRVQSQAHRTKSRFRRPEAAQSRRVCKNLFLLEDLVLVVAYLRTTRKGAAVRSAQHRTGRVPKRQVCGQHPSGGGTGGYFIWRPLDGWHLTCSAATSGADHWSPWVRNPWTSAGLVAWHAALRSLSP